jgi:hypothetical protein
MKTVLVVLAFALWACGGSDSPSQPTNITNQPKDLSHWTGAAWNGGLTTTLTCSGTPTSVNGTIGFVLSPGAGADLQYTSNDGCLFKFNVSNNTASLANAPVICSTTASGTVITITVTSYSMTTSDGRNLTLQAGGSAAAGSQTCPLALGGSLTR